MPRTYADVLTEEQFETLVRATPDPIQKAVFIIGFYEGLRVSELAALKQEHIDYENHMLNIREAITPSGKPKKQVERKIAIFKEVDEALKYVPFNIGIRTLQYWYSTAAKRMWGGKHHIHTLRHSCATWLLNVQGWGINDVRDHLGHANISSTQTYAQSYPLRHVKMARGC